ncbi:MAG: hypothetical protein ACRENY_06855 [Candidatus Dormibacteria bacterium]
MGPVSVWRGSLSGRSRGRRRQVDETTLRVRQLVDGIEAAIAQGDDLELSRYLAPPALALLLAQTAALRAAGRAWSPGRSGLRWSGSSKRSAEPGRFWLRLRFEDRSELALGDLQVGAAMSSHEVEVELDTTAAPWRLCRAAEVFPG